MIFSHAISLGYNCGTAYQLRLHTRTSEAYFFDWLYVSASAVQTLIVADFENFLDRPRCTVVRGGQEVLVMPSGARLTHSFKPDGRYIDPAVMERDFEKERAKFEHLAAKTRNVLDSGRTIAFFRYNPYKDALDEKAAILELEVALRHRLGHDGFHMFWVQNTGGHGSKPLSALTTSVQISEDKARSTSFNGNDFIGTDDVAWKEFLGGLQFDLSGRKLEADRPVLVNRA